MSNGATFRAEIEIEIINGKDRFTWSHVNMSRHYKDILDDEYEKTEDFYVELDQPVWHVRNQEGQDGADGRPVLGAHTRCKVQITEDYAFKSFVDKVKTAYTIYCISLRLRCWSIQVLQLW